MNTNDLPPAAKLAALIEAGAAANPQLAQGRGQLLGPYTACALGFACLGAGMGRPVIAGISTGNAMDKLHSAFNIPVYVSDSVVEKNDLGVPLASICHSLREGELAKVSG